MFELVLVAGLGTLAIRQISRIADKERGHSGKTVDRLEKLWKLTQLAMRDRKYIPAEKALLTILKVDHKNAPAYNRLGIVYAKQKNYDDAIECFGIASSLDPKPSSLHNLGLIYYETEKYEKAVASFEKAIETEPMAVRYIALAKAEQKLERWNEMIGALEKAVELEPNPQTYRLLVEGYKVANRLDDARDAQKKLTRMTASSTETPPKRTSFIRRPKRVN